MEDTCESPNLLSCARCFSLRNQGAKWLAFLHKTMEKMRVAMNLGSSNPQAVPLLIATCYSLEVSCWHNKILEDYDIHTINSEMEKILANNISEKG